MQRLRVITFFSLAVMLCAGICLSAEDAPRRISLDEFILTAAQNDTEFEAILINELKLKYSKDLVIPARDIVLSVRNQYDFITNQDRNEPEFGVSLSKLFPYTGTSVSAEYTTYPTFSNDVNSSAMGVTLSQSIARNAFGKATRMLDKIVGLEIDVARHQIIEAYEDYLATVMLAYINWYESYQKLDIAESSYKENLKLLDNIRERQKNKIALEVDVNKISLQVYDKEESLVSTKETYDRQLNIIKTILRYEGDEILAPVNPESFFAYAVSFDEDFKMFKDNSRTYKILDLLEKRGVVEVAKDADDLLPSINLLAGAEMQGKRDTLFESDNMLYLGVSLDWPVYPNQVERAEYEISKIALEETRLSNINIHFRLYRDVKNLYLSLQQEKTLVEIARKKNVLARSVLEDEAENYMYGKIVLNDFIQAVNAHDETRRSIETRNAQINRLMLERLRILDLLVTRHQINERPDITIQGGK
ncbi:MAG: TolC family protein [Candidatus Auribacterota bacterium]